MYIVVSLLDFFGNVRVLYCFFPAGLPLLLRVYQVAGGCFVLPLAAFYVLIVQGCYIHTD